MILNWNKNVYSGSNWFFSSTMPQVKWTKAKKIWHQFFDAKNLVGWLSEKGKTINSEYYRNLNYDHWIKIFVKKDPVYRRKQSFSIDNARYNKFFDDFKFHELNTNWFEHPGYSRSLRLLPLQILKQFLRESVFRNEEVLQPWTVFASFRKIITEMVKMYWRIVGIMCSVSVRIKKNNFIIKYFAFIFAFIKLFNQPVSRSWNQILQESWQKIDSSDLGKKSDFERSRSFKNLIVWIDPRSLELQFFVWFSYDRTGSYKIRSKILSDLTIWLLDLGSILEWKA